MDRIPDVILEPRGSITIAIFCLVSNNRYSWRLATALASFPGHAFACSMGKKKGGSGSTPLGRSLIKDRNRSRKRRGQGESWVSF